MFPLLLSITSDTIYPAPDPDSFPPSLLKTRKLLEESPALSSLNTVLDYGSVLIRIKSASARHLTRHRAIQRIEALTLDLSPEPERRDAERARAEGPEETAEGRRDEGTYTCKLLPGIH